MNGIYLRARYKYFFLYKNRFQFLWYLQRFKKKRKNKATQSYARNGDRVVRSICQRRKAVMVTKETAYLEYGMRQVMATGGISETGGCPGHHMSLTIVNILMCWNRAHPLRSADAFASLIHQLFRIRIIQFQLLNYQSTYFRIYRYIHKR